ncbi:CBS domain-containing protein [Methanothermococcus sp. Ax23]|jgi:CBS domain-containing protein|uniref:CBS domain-containing protein n=1 Tax=Methanothermococcus sp. Ax23 TaxID=3156486 RepID=UPI003B9E9554
MVNVDSVMKKPIVVNQNNDIRDVIKLFREHKISGAPVIDDDRNLVGIISESDIIKTLTTHDEKFNIVLPSPFDLIELPLKTTLKIEEFREDIEKALKTKVKDIMTKDVIVISPEASINEAAEVMTKNKIKRLPVIKNGELVGIITRGDLIEALI